MLIARSASEILDEIRRIKGLGSDTALGELFGVKQSTVSSWRARNSLPYEEIIVFCIKEGISTDNLFLIKGSAKITKETIDGLRRSIPVVIELDGLFTTRLIKELGDRSIEWLSVESRIDSLRIENLLINNAIPTFDELELIAKALNVEPRWLAEKSPIPSENWMYEFYKRDDNSLIPAEIFKLYLVAAETYIEKMRGLIKLSPELKADVINTACRVHMKEKPESKEVNTELISFLMMWHKM